MAISSREIPQEVWERHKETIIGLRFGEKLPLDNTKSDGRSMMQVMRDEHQFHATVSQYEAQLKKWAACKNLKKRDWESILPVYDDLKERGLEPRIRLGDHVLDESRVKRARRYLKGDATIGEKDGPAKSSAQARVWRLEICQPDGQYTEFSVEDEELEVLEVPLSSALVLRNTGNSPFDINSRPLLGDPIWMPDSPSLANMLSPQLAIFHPAFASPQRNPENMDEFFGSFLTQDMSTNLPFLDSDTFALVSPQGSEIYNPVRYASPSPLQTQWMLSKDCIESMLRSISQEPRFRLSINSKFLDAQVILDKLESLLNDNFFEEDPGDGFALIFRGTISMSEIHRRIIFSIVNNFAGFQDISPAIILNMLRIDPKMSLYLFEGLRSDDLTIAKPLADNLFRAAIEAGDEEAVGIIIEITSGRMNEIYLNRIVCQFRRHWYTPIALASHLQYFNVVQKLLSFGARVYVASWEPDDYFNGCALAAIISSWHLWDTKDAVGDNSEAIRIVGLLLANGAEVTIRLLEEAIHTIRQNSALIEMLVQAIPRERHHELFDSYKEDTSDPDQWDVSILCCIVEELEDQLADKIIRNLITTCQTMNCTPSCTVEYSQTLGEILFLVTLKGNFELAEYLLSHTRPTIGHLAAAIRSGRPGLIDLMMKQGISVGGEAVCFENMSHSYANCRKPRHLCRRSCDFWTSRDDRSNQPTTPLAEAIRLQNYGLIRRLENCGAIDRISDEATFEFQAAVFAIAEVGNFPYLGRLLTLVPTADRECLEGSIKKAIEMGHVEIAMTLLFNCARREPGNYGCCYRGNCDLLRMALEKRNREIVDTLLEYLSFDYLHQYCEHFDVIEEAVRWGEKSIVKDLLQLGILASSTAYALKSLKSPLAVAIASRNTELAALLLEWGADPSELEGAIRIGDMAMMRLLLHHGADPADDKAFSVVLESGNRLLLSALLDAFSSRYPDGKKGFGAEALMTAILSHDASILEVLLKVKFDVNNYMNMTSYGGYGRTQILIFAINHTLVNNLEMNQIIRLLLDAGADPEAVGSGKTALLEAINVKNLQVVKLLLSKGSDINRPARRGLKRTPLQFACEQDSFQIVEFLLHNGADVHAPPAMNGGATALQLAAIQGSVRIVRLLLDRGADIHAAPAVVNGRTALEGAAEYGRVSVLNILLAEGTAGYSVEDIKSAKAYAEEKGHRGCEERLKLALFRFGEAGRLRASLCL